MEESSNRLTFQKNVMGTSDCTECLLLSKTFRILNCIAVNMTATMHLSIICDFDVKTGVLSNIAGELSIFGKRWILWHFRDIRLLYYSGCTGIDYKIFTTTYLSPTKHL